jgi:hypothetical protein
MDYFAPFMATLYALLIIVFISLLFGYLVERFPFLYWDITIIGLTASLSLVLGISDRI